VCFCFLCLFICLDLGRLSIEGLNRDALAASVAGDRSILGEIEIVELDQMSDDEDMEQDSSPPKKSRRGGTSATSRSRPARSSKTSKSSGSASASSTDMWSVMESGFWLAADRPSGQFQDRSWINSQYYETLSMMKKVSSYVRLSVYLLVI